MQLPLEMCTVITARGSALRAAINRQNSASQEFLSAKPYYYKWIKYWQKCVLQIETTDNRAGKKEYPMQMLLNKTSLDLISV